MTCNRDVVNGSVSLIGSLPNCSAALCAVDDICDSEEWRRRLNYVSGAASWVRVKLGWYPITASSKKRSTIALSRGEAEMVAALPGACEAMGLRQQWNWLLKFGRDAEETNATTQQIPCCDSSVALGVIQCKGSSRKSKQIELKTFFPQRDPSEVRLVKVETSEMHAAVAERSGSSTAVAAQRGKARDGGSGDVIVDELETNAKSVGTETQSMCSDDGQTECDVDKA